MCPGCRKSRGCACGATAAWIVRARSCAEMPVVTPSAASIEIVKFVVCRTSVLLTISGRRSCSQRARVSVRQISPRPYFDMKLTSSARTFAAAMTRSPSFSRSSSSRMTTISPARTAATISSVLFSGDQALSVVACVTMFPQEGEIDAAAGVDLNETFEIARQHVDLNINSGAARILADHRHGLSVRDDVDVEFRRADAIHREAHTVDGNGPFRRYVARQRRRHLDDEPLRAADVFHRNDLADAVDVAR